MKTIYILGVGIFAVLFISVSVASAHTVVSPRVTTGNSYQIFSVGVPSERDSTTIGIRLIVPEGAASVRPNVKPGWQVSLKKAMVGGKESVTEINWTGGSVPTGLRDDFYFSLKTPTTTELIWKAYQTYADGKVIAWDGDPATGKFDHESPNGPYSITEVEGVAGDEHMMHNSPTNSMSSMSASSHFLHFLLLPILAIVISLIAYFQVARREK